MKRSEVLNIIREVVRGNMTFRNWSDSLNKKYKLKTGEIITLDIDKSEYANYTSLNVIAYDSNNNKIGGAHFNSDETNDKNKLTSSDTYVKKDFRRKGVASIMYQYVKDLGYNIISSSNQSPEGKRFTGSLQEEKKAKKAGIVLKKSKLKEIVLEVLYEKSVHDPVKPGILKKRLGKLSCSKVRTARGKLKDKGTHYAKALQRYLNYHCQ